MAFSQLRKVREISIIVLLLGSNFAKADWVYVQSTDPFEDHDTSSVSPDLASYSSDNELAISVRCEFDGLNILLTHSYMNGDSDEEVLAVLRIDKNEAYGPTYWDLQGNTQSWMPLRNVRKVVEEMKQGDRILIRLIDPSDDEQLFEDVSLDGFDSAVEKLACYKI